MKNKSIIFKFNAQRLEYFFHLIKNFVDEFQIIIYLDGDIDRCKKSVKDIFEQLKLNQNIIINENKYEPFTNNKIIDFLHKYCLNSLSQIVLKYLYMYYYKKEYNYFKTYLTKMDTKAVFLPDDRLRRFGNGLLKASQELHIKVILPYLYTCQKHSPILFYKSTKYYNKAFGSLYQRYVFNKMEKKENQLFQEHFFYHAFVLDAQDRLGMLSSNPWCLGYGLSDVVCVDSDLTIERLNKEIGYNDKFVVTGDIVYDALFSSYSNQEKILAKYKQNNRKRVLISVAAFYETGLFSLEESQKKVEFLVESVATFDVNIFISFHPMVTISNYSYLRDKYPCIFIDEPLYEVLPTVDLLVNSVSSTINWAILCGVKSCILANMYDDSGLNQFYNQFDSVLNVYHDEDFIKGLSMMLYNEIDFTKDWEKLSRDTVFNGKVMSKYKEIVNG
ncbi:MAG: hypothetical protein RBT59_00050 [Arcobacteraceae bacterium]|jgi:hypothetical protein|nr:hypothetical protein [Arcobacteraceae bacterium]